MKKPLFLILILTACLSVNSQNKTFLDVNYIETQATVDTLVIPNEIKLAIVIKELDSKGKITTEVLEQRMKKTLEALKIDTKKDLVLSDAMSDFKSYLLKKKDILKTKNYTLTLKDAVTTGKVILELERVEISNVSIASVNYSELEDLKTKLKARAILKAKENADTILNALGKSTGDPLHVIDQNYVNTYNTRASQMYVKESHDDKESLDVEFEKIKVKTSLSVKFAIN